MPNVVDDFFRNRRKFQETMEGLEDELHYMVTHDFFARFEQMAEAIDKMVSLMEELNSNIKEFNSSIQKISVNTESISQLEQRMSIRGLITSTIKDFFFFLRQIIQVAIVSNWKRLEEITSSKRGKNHRLRDQNLLPPKFDEPPK